jgi:hypothetical protein
MNKTMGPLPPLRGPYGFRELQRGLTGPDGAGVAVHRARLPEKPVQTVRYHPGFKSGPTMERRQCESFFSSSSSPRAFVRS